MWRFWYSVRRLLRGLRRRKRYDVNYMAPWKRGGWGRD